MTDHYDIDIDDSRNADDARSGETPPDREPDPERAGANRPTGVPIPPAHVGAFVAETFEDPERDTAWDDVVERLIADGARDAWEALAVQEQVEELLSMADDYDRQAIDLLEDLPVHDGDDTDRRVPVHDGDGTEPVDPRFEEALRRRRNADIVRDGIADAYASGRIDDRTLVAAVESFGFDTERIAAREDRLETVANAHDLDFRPYGGMLFSTGSDGEGGSAAPLWEVDP